MPSTIDTTGKYASHIRCLAETMPVKWVARVLDRASAEVKGNLAVVIFCDGTHIATWERTRDTAKAMEKDFRGAGTLDHAHGTYTAKIDSHSCRCSRPHRTDMPDDITMVPAVLEEVRHLFLAWLEQQD